MIAGKVFGRAIVGPCIALAASISVTGLGVSSLTRSGLWEPLSPGGRFAVILSPSMQRNPLDQGRRPGSPLELCFFICIHRRQVGLRIQPPCQKLSWIDHWGLRLQSSLLANWVAVTCLNQLGTLSLWPLVVGTARGGAEHCLPPPPVGSLITSMLLQSCKSCPNRSHHHRVNFVPIAFFVLTTSLLSSPKPHKKNIRNKGVPQQKQN